MTEGQGLPLNTVETDGTTGVGMGSLSLPARCRDNRARPVAALLRL